MQENTLHSGSILSEDGTGQDNSRPFLEPSWNRQFKTYRFSHIRTVSIVKGISKGKEVMKLPFCEWCNLMKRKPSDQTLAWTRTHHQRKQTKKQTKQAKGDKASTMTLSCICAQNTEQSAKGIRKNDSIHKSTKDNQNSGIGIIKNAKLAHRKLKQTFLKETKWIRRCSTFTDWKTQCPPDNSTAGEYPQIWWHFWEKLNGNFCRSRKRHP